MKRFLFTVLLILGIGAAGCAASTPVPPPIAVPPIAPTLAASTPVLPTSVPATALPTVAPAVPATAVPQANLGETKTYRDELAGFELDYPANWNLTPVGDEAKKNSIIYSATLYSWQSKSGSQEGIPPGGTKIDAAVFKNNASSPEAALAQRKQEFANGDLGQTVLSEQAITLPSGIKAARLIVKDRFGESLEIITALNNNTILLGGVGDYAVIDAIARTLRPLDESSSTRYHNAEGKFSLLLPAGWQVNGPLQLENDPARPLHLYVLGVDPSAEGGPGASRIVIADDAQWTPAQFAQTQCSTCPSHPFEELILGGKVAQRSQVGGGGVPFVTTWHFVHHDNKLIAMAIHDPETLQPLDDVISSIRFD